MKQTHSFAAVFVLLLCLSACGGRSVQETAKEGTSRPVPVKTEIASLTEGRIFYKVPGTVKSRTVASLASKIMGTVLEVRVRAGDHIQKGQVLVLVDPREIDAMVEKAKAGLREVAQALQEMDRNIEAAQSNFKLASTTLKRYEELATQKSVSPQEFDEVKTKQQATAASLEALQSKKKQVEARLRQAESEVLSAQVLRSYTEVPSPLDGVVLERLIEPGMLATPGIPLLSIEETGQYRLEVAVEESRMAGLKIGQGIFVRFDTMRPPELKGTIAEIQPAADPASRTFVVRIHLPQNKQLRAGIYGEALFDAGVSKGIWIPPTSVIHQGQLEGVYVLGKDNRARLRLLKLGEVTEQGIEVLSGLEGGETYVTQLKPELCDGCLVEVSQ